MPTLPRSYGSLLVRTDFTSDAAWQQVVDAALREDEEGYAAGIDPHSDPDFDQASWQTVKSACPADPGAAVLFIADSTTLTSPDHPILVVDLMRNREPFRCVPAAVGSVEANLNIANMDWEEFADEAGEDGIFRGFRAVLEAGDPRLPGHGLPVMLDVHQPVTATDRATVELLRIDVSRAGCEFTIKAVVDVSGMTAREEKRARRAVDGYRSAALPGATSAGPLQVTLGFAGGRTAEYREDPLDLPRSGPGVSGFGGSAYPDGSYQVREERFWTWPLPPAEPFTLTVEWPAMGISPASITVDGAMIARVAASLPPE
jgi:hypothetical protein